MKRYRKIKFSFSALFWGVVLILMTMFIYASGVIQNMWKRPAQLNYATQKSEENIIIEDSIEKSVYLASKDLWYTGITEKSDITSITITPGFPRTPSVEAGERIETWDASEMQNGRITCQVIGTELYIYTHGADKILLNVDASYTFAGFSSVSEIYGLELLDTSETANMYWMFGDCDKLREIKIPLSWDTGKVQNMSYMFYNNASLKMVDINNLDMSAVVDMSYMFGFCSAIDTLDVSSWTIERMSSVCTRSQMFMQTGIADFSLKVRDAKMAAWMKGDPTTAQNNTMLRKDTNIIEQNHAP